MLTSPPPPRVSQRTILLVEDNDDVSATMTKALVRAGFMVMTAPTGHDAFETIRAPLSPIDLILLDIGLPDVSGVALCARIFERQPKLKVVVCTGGSDPDEAAELLKMGVSAYFRKPFRMDELLAAINDATS